MKTKKEEVVTVAETIEVINMDEFLTLDTKLQEKITNLSKVLNISHLNKFNPLVKRIIDIESYRKLKFVKDDKDCIQSYKEAIADIRNYRAQTKKACTEIKKPLIQTGKDIVLVREVFVNDATSVEDFLKIEFKSYLDEVEKKKVIAQEKKDKAKNDQIEGLTEEANATGLVIQRMTAYTNLSKSINEILSTATENAKTFSEPALVKEIDQLNSLNFEINFTDEGLLIDDQIQELTDSFIVAKESAISVLNTAIANLKAETPIPSEEVVAPPVIVAPTMADNNPNFIRDSLVSIISDAVIKIEQLQPALPKEVSAVNSAKTGLQNYCTTITNYFVKE